MGKKRKSPKVKGHGIYNPKRKSIGLGDEEDKIKDPFDVRVNY